MQLSCVDITFVVHSSQKLWPEISFWEIAHCILHCNVGVCVTTLKTQNNLSCKLGNFSTKNCGLNAKFEDCIFKDNPNLHTPLQCTVNHGVSIIFWIVCYFQMHQIRVMRGHELTNKKLREAIIREKKRFFMKSLHKMVTPPIPLL